MDVFPKISIVTPSYNQGQFLEQTITSVLEQNYPNLEYIIIDGGSTDNSVEIIKKYQKHLKFWTSEKDKGQTNAINKGLKHCTGEIFNWLNSDDYLSNRSLFEIATLFKDDHVHLVAGNIEFFGDGIESYIGENKELTADGLMCWKRGVRFNQPGVWMSRSLIDRSGGLNEGYHYCFDREMLVRYLYQFPNVIYSDSVFVRFRLHPESKTVSSNKKFAIEGDRLIEDVFCNPNLKGLHADAKLKIACKNWSELLRQATSSDSNKLKKCWKIISNLSKHPSKGSYYRMTAGAIKNILFQSNVPKT